MIMARKVVIKTQYSCRDCNHSYDWHEIAFDTGKPFMCRCPHYEGGRFTKFLKDNQCEYFELNKERDGDTK